jgi:hypothetical protein
VVFNSVKEKTSTVLLELEKNDKFVVYICKEIILKKMRAKID